MEIPKKNETVMKNRLHFMHFLLIEMPFCSVADVHKQIQTQTQLKPHSYLMQATTNPTKTTI